MGQVYIISTFRLMLRFIVLIALLCVRIFVRIYVQTFSCYI